MEVGLRGINTIEVGESGTVNKEIRMIDVSRRQDG